MCSKVAVLSIASMCQSIISYIDHEWNDKVVRNTFYQDIVSTHRA